MNMLPDFERKILRILYNYINQRRRMPTLNELETKTGQDKKRISEALMFLKKDNYISWDDQSDLNTIIILEGWERESSRPQPQITDSGSVDYWTRY